MSRPRNFFLPPILQVLDEGRHQQCYTEGPSNVITWIDLDSVQLSTPGKKTKRPQTPLSQLMKTIDLRDTDSVKDGEEHFSYIVCFPPDEEEHNKDNMDMQTLYSQRTLTSRLSFPNLSIANSLWKTNVISGLRSAAKRILPSKTTHATESTFKRFRN